MSRRSKWDHVRALERRATYLRDTAIPLGEKQGNTTLSFMRRKLSALEWAISHLTDALLRLVEDKRC